MTESAEVQAELDAADKHTSGKEMQEFTLEEVEKHNKEHDCWIILNGNVYDATSVLAWHPGGVAAIMTYAGRATVQASVQYNSIHDAYARRKTQEVMIGKLSKQILFLICLSNFCLTVTAVGANGVQALEADAKRIEAETAALREARKPYALQPEHNMPVQLVNVKHESDDTRLVMQAIGATCRSDSFAEIVNDSVYTFKLPEINGKLGKLGLAIGKHLHLSTHWLDSVVMR